MEFRVHNPELLEYTDSDFSILVMGGVRLTGLEKLRCTLKINYKEQNYPFRSTVDLYNRDQVEKLIRELSDHFSYSLSETRKIINALTSTLENYRIQLHTDAVNTVKTLSDTERKAAVKYLSEPDLLNRLNELIGKSGIIREELNRMLMYLVFTSRKLTNPLHIYTLGPSGIGKTHLQQHISLLIPDEDKLEITSLTSNSLYYFTKEELNQKLLCIEDLDGIGVDGMYVIRELQTSKKITRTIAERDGTGNIKAIKKTVEARVCIAATTTREKLYEDNANRVIVIHPDTSDEQSKAIIQYQQKKAAGKIKDEQQNELIHLLQNLQRVLEPIKVINPIAEKLILPETVGTPRRLMNIYLTLIETITFIHQHQREMQKDKDGNSYILSTGEDVRWANLLLRETLLTKSDDLAPQVRGFFEQVKKHVKINESFTAKEIRETQKISASSLARYIKDLLEKEYLKAEGNRYKGYYYKINTDNFDSKKAIVEAFSKSVLHQ